MEHVWIAALVAAGDAAPAAAAAPPALDLPEVLLWHWGVFGVGVAILLALDLFVFNRESHEPSLQESLGFTIFFAALALAFNGLLWWWLGAEAGIAFLTGYVVEWSLSMDNVFVFFVVFTFFGVPLKYQHRVLFWGILGAVLMRLTFVAGAAFLLHYLEWVILLFGAFLVYTGVRLAFVESEVNPDDNWLLQFARRNFPVAEGSHGENFTVEIEGKTHITPLFLVLLVIESTDLLFAVDSVPAIIGVVGEHIPKTESAFMFVAFTSNVFAILGLRALYFLLARSVGMFRYLNTGLALVLMFIGVKMMVDYGWAWYHPVPEGQPHAKLIPPWVSITVIFGILTVAVVASLVANQLYPAKEESDGGEEENAGKGEPVGEGPAAD